MYTLKSLKYLVFSAPMALTALFSSNSAHAQMEYMAEIMQPEYMARDLILFAEGLNLDDMQEIIVEGFFNDYEDDFQIGWSATQERLNAVAVELRDKPDATERDTLEPVLTALGDWVVAKRQLDDGLLENIKVILLPDQKMLWPAFSQRLYREKNIRRGRLSGESVDLFQITRDADLQSAAESAIAPHLEEYAIALDIAIRNRDSILRGNPKKLFDNILSGSNEKSPILVDNAIKARVEVRDINDRYVELISENLSAVDGEDFRLRALKRGYTRVYRRTPAERILKQAANNELFSEGTRAQIFQLETAYLLELADLNFVLLQQTRSYEPALHKNRELAGQVRKNGGTPEKLDDPTRDMYKEREALGERYIEMLQALLTEEEFLELDGARRWIPRPEQNNIAPAIAPSGKTGGLSTANSFNKGQDPAGKGAKGRESGGRESGGRTSPRAPGLKSGTGLGSTDQ